MEQAELRRYINKQFSIRCLSLNKDSLSYLTDQLKEMDKSTCQKTIARVMELVEKENLGGSSELLSLDKLKEILILVSRQKKNESEIVFKLEDAFEWRKKLAAEKRRGVLLKSSKSPWDLLSFDVYLQRFDLVRKALKDGQIQQLTPVESLLVKRGKRVRVLAQLCLGTGAGFVGEDPTGTIGLELAGAEYEPGIYFEGGIFIFEGICSDIGNTIQVDKVSLPLLKSNNLIDEMHGGGQKQESSLKKDPNDRIVFFSDLLLDNEKVMKALYHILQGFVGSPPNVFVFCGNFLSVQLAHGYTEQSQTAFRHLANIIAEFALNYPDTKFVLVPNIGDPLPLSVFPRPILPPNIQKCFKDVRNIHFATNPCRLIFKDQHILICRDDIVEKLCRTAIHIPKNAKAVTIPKLFCDTIWSQRHISPLPLYYSPVQPNFDPLFQLWPAPDVLVLADKFKAFVQHEDEDDNANGGKQRLTMNPGPFGATFEFQVYFPTLKRVEHSVYTPEER